ncbi:MAG: ImmA/IrrE family metallo-endopeptidase [Acetobacter orientalis]|uniref:ImmA/IrrE family metallo-endopeptidase n=1 Tax=Acetobacter orientalis TaxID=146474 RepID=UPI0039E966EE
MVSVVNSGSIVTPYDIAGRYLAKAPVDLIGMARALGISVDMNTEMDNPDISGIIKRNADGRYSVQINGSDNAKRKKFTLAHEIAHYLLHRDLIDKAAVIDDGMYRSGLPSSIETQANRLAADLLMPAQLVKDLWKIGVCSVFQLSEIFQASEAAVRIRLKQLGYGA